MNDTRMDNRSLPRISAPGLLVFFLALALASCSGTGDGENAGGQAGGDRTKQAASGTERYMLPGEEVFPEGVAYQSDTGDFYVSSTTDGTIFRGNVEGGSK